MFYPGEDVRFEEASRPVSSHLHHYIILSFRSFFLNQSYRVFFKSRHVIIKDGVKMLSLKKPNFYFFLNRDISGLL